MLFFFQVELPTITMSLVAPTFKALKWFKTWESSFLITFFEPSKKTVKSQCNTF